ncbi:MAG TPA: IS630 family transposase [Chloroflexi bacterium]|nr:IS630 family transposase [Chloroflexota bacterium]
MADFSAALEKKVLDLAQASEPSVILARDEAALDLQATVQRVWAPNGQTPVVRVAPTRQSVHCYGTLNLLTGQEVSMRTETMNAAASARHLPQRLEADPTGQILLLWDQAPWHQGAAIRDILAANPRLELMRLPPAAPALNPQEHVCKAVRSAVSHNHTLARFPDLVERGESALAATTFPCALLDTLNFHHLRILFTMSN